MKCKDKWHELKLMGQYLAWSIPRTRRFKFVQIKFLGSKNGHALREHIFI